jgi:hypothetical protein
MVRRLLAFVALVGLLAGPLGLSGLFHHTLFPECEAGQSMAEGSAHLVAAKAVACPLCQAHLVSVGAVRAPTLRVARVSSNHTLHYVEATFAPYPCPTEVAPRAPPAA